MKFEKSEMERYSGRSTQTTTPDQSVPAREARLAYLPGLDGLRAVAVMAVLLYHADLIWFRGGYLGVDVFFVLSGFLITSLLLAEWRKDGVINLKAFWLRRARRLLPALFLMLGSVLAFAVIFLPDEVASLRNDAIAASTYVTNWYLVFNDMSYFETIGRPSLFQHLWSLAVEEQFYLLWPVFFIILMRFFRRFALPIVVAGAAVSAAGMWLAYNPDIDPSRIYYGTDTRAASLLIGVALALVLSQTKTAQSGSRNAAWLLDLAGLAALAAVVWYFLVLDETQELVYRGGMLALETATAVVILSLVFPGTRVMPWLLSGRAIRWIGQRSYGIYLWHWPVFMVTRPQVDLLLNGLPLIGLRFGLTFLLAELSYRFIETPIRNGGLGHAWKDLRMKHNSQRSAVRVRWAGTVSVLLGLGILVGVPVVEAKPPAPPSYLATQSVNTVDPDAGLQAASVETGQISSPGLSQPEVVDDTPTPVQSADLAGGDPSEDFSDVPTEPAAINQMPPAPTTGIAPPGAAAPTTVSPGESTAPLQPISPDSAAQTAPSTPTPTIRAPAAVKPTEIASLGRITAVGDSVMLGAAKNLKQLGDVYIDAAVSRQVSQAIALLRTYHSAGRLGPVVILHIGTNGTFTAKQFDQIMSILSDEKYVLFVNLKVPRSWEWPNNKVIMGGVARYPNAIMVDWRAASVDRPELLYRDGIHMRPEGAQVYTNLIGNALKSLVSP